jgi:hypothetical protein
MINLLYQTPWGTYWVLSCNSYPVGGVWKKVGEEFKNQFSVVIQELGSVFEK